LKASQKKTAVLIVKDKWLDKLNVYGINPIRLINTTEINRAVIPIFSFRCKLNTFVWEACLFINLCNVNIGIIIWVGAIHIVICTDITINIFDNNNNVIDLFIDIYL
jgi:hypothetical protein